MSDEATSQQQTPSPDPDIYQPLLDWWNNNLPIKYLLAVFLIGCFLRWLWRKHDNGELYKERVPVLIASTIAILLPTLLVLLLGGHMGTATTVGVLIAVLFIIFKDIDEVTKSVNESAESTTHINTNIDHIKQLITKKTDIENSFIRTIHRIFSPEGDDLQKKISKDIYIKKHASLCDQIDSERIWLSEKLFNHIWRTLIGESSEYYSICDLSIYSNKFKSIEEREFKYEKDIWIDRINSEYQELNKFIVLNKFKKIIVFDKNHQGECYKNSNHCTHEDCDIKCCMVKVVVDEWSRLLQQDNQEKLLIVKDKDTIVDGFYRHNNLTRSDENDRLQSIDIGIFGHDYIGEEYKYTLDIPYDKDRLVGYVYKFRKDNKVSEQYKKYISELS